MFHKWVWNNLDPYLYGCLRFFKRMLVRWHLTRCPICRRELEQMRKLARAIGEAGK